MEQIYMFEVFVKRIELKIEPYVKDEWEIEQERLEAEREAAKRAAEELLKKGKKAKPPKPKKEKKGKKGPAGPSEEELKFMQSCTVQMNCLPIFDFYIAHDNFVAPPPPAPPPKKGKAKPKKGKAVPFKLALPSEPLPQPPYFGVGSLVIIASRASTMEEVLRKTPLYITVWNRDDLMNCVGFCVIEWHESFLETLRLSAELNPLDMDKGLFRNPRRPEMTMNSVEYTRPLQCEDGLQPAGEIEFIIRLTCMGNKIISSYVQLPEMERLPARKYVNDEMQLKDMEIVRHWEGTQIEDAPTVSWFYQAPDIVYKPIIPVEVERVYSESDYVISFTNSELAILSMGFPKGPCGGVNCPKRMDFRGSQHQFIHGEYVKGKYQHGQFVNKRDVHGPCGRLDCPLAKKVRAYICNEGAYKTCKKPCPKEYY